MDDEEDYYDVDGDGDLDAFVGLADGTIIFFENISTDTVRLQLTVTPENDAPSATGLPATLVGVVGEETFVSLETAFFADPDGDVVTVTLQAAGGTLSVAGMGTADVILIQNDAQTVSLAGAPGALNNFVAGFTDGTSPIVFIPDGNMVGLDVGSIGVTVDDGAQVVDAGTISIDMAARAPIIVTTLDDSNDAGDGVISLREAVAMANGEQGFDTIVFDETLAGENDLIITLTDGTLSITDSLAIDASAVPGLVISGDVNGDDIRETNGLTDINASVNASAGSTLTDNVRLFMVAGETAPTLTLTGLTLTGGHAMDSAGGGAVLSNGDVTVISSLIAGNAAAAENVAGGAIATPGDIMVINTTVVGNGALGAGARGGALAGSAITVSASTLTGNFATGAGAFGGALLAQDAVMLANAIILGNMATGSDPELAFAMAGGLVTTQGMSIVGADGTAFDGSMLIGVI
ncbi:MAG: Ig-like domain-containing protein, partial [Pseudomonadota bacterium]